MRLGFRGTFLSLETSESIACYRQGACCKREGSQGYNNRKKPLELLELSRKGKEPRVRSLSKLVPNYPKVPDGGKGRRGKNRIAST